MSPIVCSRGPASIARAIVLSAASLIACGRAEPPTPTLSSPDTPVSRIRQVLARVPSVLEKNHKTFVVPDGTIEGFGAGDAYPQIWLRDSAWIVPAAAEFHETRALLSWLDLHLVVAEKSGRLRDWVATGTPDLFREWAPHVAGVGALAVDTNTNESDQEPSAALAYCRAVDALGGAAEVSGAAHERRMARLVKAMEALIRDRTDSRSGLIWSGLTADWGDVSPLYPDQRAIYKDAQTPRTLALYSNVMVYAALDCLASLDGPEESRARLAAQARALRDRVRAAFWMESRGRFRIRLPLDPLPPGFSDDDERFALGGNALAVLHDVATDDQAAAIFATAERLRVANRFATISTSLIPPYAKDVFQHPAMREPFQYQNGGQWDWFGAALVQAEFERGYSEAARAHLDQIVTRILSGGPGIHEWYAQDGSPKGSAAYAAAAASLYQAITKGWLGVSRSRDGLRVVIRSGETIPPIEIGTRSALRIGVSQAVNAASIDVVVTSAQPVREVCTVMPRGSRPRETAGGKPDPLRSTRQIARDTLACADTSSSASPIRLAFAVEPLR